MLAVLEKEMNFIVLIRKISNHDEQEVETALLKIPISEKSSSKLV